MKKSILFLLIISTLIIFNSCGKDYDYRDKWVGEYEYEHWHGPYLHGTGTLSVNKYGQDSILITIGNGVLLNSQVHKNGDIELCKLDWDYRIGGSFKNRNYLELPYYLYYYPEDNYIYKCKKIKE